MKKILLVMAIATSATMSLAQQSATGTSRFYTYGQYTGLQIKGASAQALYINLSTEPKDLSDAKNSVQQKVGTNLSCTEEFSKKTKKLTYSCDVQIDMATGGFGEGAVG